MSLISFVKNLVSSIKKDDVNERIRSVIDANNNFALAALSDVKETIAEANFKSKFATAFKTTLLSVFKSLRGKPNPLYQAIEQTIKNSNEILEYLSDKAGKAIPQVLVIEGISYHQANILRIIDLLDFYADYTQRVLAYIAASEYGVVIGVKKAPYTPAELKWLHSNQYTYFKIMEILSHDPSKIIRQLDAVPDIIVFGDDDDGTPALQGGSGDPLSLGFIPGLSGWIGRKIVDWEVERYNAARKLARDIQLRLEGLRQKQAGHHDSRTEIIINNYERELALTRARIQMYEERVK